MIDLMSLIISPAFAAEAADAMPPANDLVSILMRYLPVILIFLVFYFVLIRPQQKKFEQQSAMITALKKGDKVIVLGGILGTIAKLEGDDQLMIDIGGGTQMKVLRNSVSGLDLPKVEKADKKKA